MGLNCTGATAPATVAGAAGGAGAGGGAAAAAYVDGNAAGVGWRRHEQAAAA